MSSSIGGLEMGSKEEIRLWQRNLRVLCIITSSLVRMNIVFVAILISLDDLLQACSFWEKFDVPVILRKFDSGVMVIQSEAHGSDECSCSLKSRRFFVKPDAHRTGISTSDATMMLGMAPAMVEEHLLHAETKGMSPISTLFRWDGSQACIMLLRGRVRYKEVYWTWIASA
ncbi:Vacuolar protein sorting-associated protein 36-like protein [Drosera capensis]